MLGGGGGGGGCCFGLFFHLLISVVQYAKTACDNLLRGSRQNLSLSIFVCSFVCSFPFKSLPSLKDKESYTHTKGENKQPWQT